jgi:hypothetical protein
MHSDPYASPIICAGRGIDRGYLEKWRTREQYGAADRDTFIAFDYLLPAEPPTPRKMRTCRTCGCQFPQLDGGGNQPNCVACRDKAADEADARRRAARAEKMRQKRETSSK